jgi:carbonic anhydrase
MDVRVDPLHLLGLVQGDAHVLRNAGGLVNDDVLRSLVVSQRMLGTRHTVIIQHTDCGLQRIDDNVFAQALERETGRRPPWRAGAFVDAAAQARQSLAALRACPWLVSRAASAYVYDVTTGALTAAE